jgi:UMF1 family MFS transporter
VKNKNKIFVWTLYDFANTSFSIVIVTAIFAVYFKKTIAQGMAIGDFYWSLATSISMVITALIAPVLGAIADYSAGKKRFLLFFTLLCIVATACLYFPAAGQILIAMAIFILANIGFEAALVFYDSYLPEITEPKNFGRVSGYGFAMGYVGSFASLAIAFPFVQNEMVKATFPVAAVFFLIFALPIFLFLKDNRKKVEGDVAFIKIGVLRVVNTITHLKNYKNLAYFLLAFFFYIEGVNTVIFFAGNFASSTIGMSDTEVLIFFLTVQSTAIAGAILFGIVSDSYGQKKSIVISLLLWIITIVLAFFVKDKIGFYIVGFLAGSVMGATQSTSRSLMSMLTPEDKKTEFFGFYSFFGKSSAVIGPLVFGLVSYVTNNQRYAILSMIVFFVLGLAILTKVKDPKTNPI